MIMFVDVDGHEYKHRPNGVNNTDGGGNVSAHCENRNNGPEYEYDEDGVNFCGIQIW